MKALWKVQQCHRHAPQGVLEVPGRACSGELTCRLSFAPRGSSTWRPQSYPRAARIWISARPDCALLFTVYVAGHPEPPRAFSSLTCSHLSNYHVKLCCVRKDVGHARGNVG